MKKEAYLKSREVIKIKEKELSKDLVVLVAKYIDANKTFNIDDKVEITLESDRKVSGEIKSYGILKDDGVYITSYKDGSNMKYITTPHQKVTLL